MRRRTLLGGLGATVAAAGSPPPEAAARRPLAVALGSGSMHGLAHIGVVRAFERLALAPDVIVGCSAGAIVGALWAAGLDAATIERHGRALDWSGSTSWALPWRGLKRADGLRRIVAEAVGHRRIEQLPRRFAAVASDLADGSLVVIDEGAVDHAVAASCAMPVLFVPVHDGARELVDGSLAAPVPVDVARHKVGTDAVVLAVDVAYRPSDEPPRWLGDIAFQTLHILVNALAAEQMQRADVALRLSLHPLMRSAHTMPAALIDAGEKAVLEAWPRLRTLLG